jgi:hypothetical protein
VTRPFAVTLAVMLSLSLVPAAAQNTVSIKRQMIQQSIQTYPGNCPCPYNRASNGSRCGGRSAWSRPGGYSPICYSEDISDAMVRSWLARNNLRVTRPGSDNSVGTIETIRLVQIQLNRLGCQLGTPDGIIGPQSRSALRKYAKTTNSEFRVSNFRSKLFLRKLAALSAPVCVSG